jgi:hypothetical protein
VTDPIGTIEHPGEHERPLSVEAVQRRVERAQRGGGAPAMSAYQRQLAGYEIERTPGERLDGRTTIGWPQVASGAGERSIHVGGGY